MNEVVQTKKNPEVYFAYSGFEQAFFLNGIPFSSSIPLDQNSFSKDVMLISIEAGFGASLDWKEAEKEAENAVKEGRKIFWEINLGLFSSFSSLLSDDGQFFVLKLALEHFRKTLWASFQEATFGVLLYKGSADFSASFPWNIEEEIRFQDWLGEKEKTPFSRRIFCQEVCMEYLSLLIPSLPEEALPFILLDATSLISAEFLCLTAREKYPHVQLAVKRENREALAHFPFLNWRKNNLEAPISKPIKIGLCLPSMQMYEESLWHAVSEVAEKIQGPFLIMSELYLQQEWDGIDSIIIFSKGISRQLKRKLQGFCAAGGQIVYADEPLGMLDEISLEFFHNSTICYKKS